MSTTLKINDYNIIDLTDFETDNGKNSLWYGRVVENGIKFHIGDDVHVVDSDLHQLQYGVENQCVLELTHGDTIVVLDLNNINVIVGSLYYVYTAYTEHIKSLLCEGVPGEYNGEAKIDILSFPLRADSQYRYKRQPRLVQYMDNVSSWFLYNPKSTVFDQYKDGDIITMVEADGNCSALAVGITTIVTSKQLKILVGGGSVNNTTAVFSIDKPLDDGNRYKVIISKEELYLKDIDPTIEQQDDDTIVIDNYDLGRDIYCNESTDKWLFLLELDSEDNIKYWAKEKTFFTVAPNEGYNTIPLTCVIGSSDNYCKLITDDAPENMYYMYAFTDEDPILYTRPNKQIYTYWDGHSEIKAHWGARIEVILISNNRIIKTGKTDCEVYMGT